MPSLATYMTATDARPLGRALRRRGRRNPGTGAVINAIVDALSELGVHHIEIPAIPERVRCAIQDAPRFQAIEARHLGVQIDAYDQCQAGRVCPRGAWQRQSVWADDKKEGCLAMFPATSLLMRRQGKIFPCQASPERGEMDV